LPTFNNNQLTVKNLAVFRSELPLFEAISFTLNSGEALQISGTNGSGKTSLLRCLSGLSQRFEGQVDWNGNAIKNNHQLSFFQQLLYLGHSLGLKPKLTVEQNLSFYQQLRFAKNENIIVDTLKQLKIAGYLNELVGHLSAGQKRRVALARIICEPVPLWILDEPMVALDTEGQDWLEKCCNQHLKCGGMILLTSHQRLSGIDGLKEIGLKDVDLHAYLNQASQI